MAYIRLLYKEGDSDILISLIHLKKLQKILDSVLDENEFLSPYGIRSVSKKHESGYEIEINGKAYTLKYTPGESTSAMFGGNSNWRGPVWFPINYLMIQSLQAYYRYFGDELKVECPGGSGNLMNLKDVANHLKTRLEKIFTADSDGCRPVYGRFRDFYTRPGNKDLILFHEYFHGETGMGLGASHQTGWTGLIAALIKESRD